MPKCLMLLACTLLCLANLRAQVVTIGTDTTSTDSTDVCGLYNQSFELHRVQILYTAAEITAGGGVAGPMTGLAFFCTGLPDALSEWNVRMAATALPNLNDTFANAMLMTVVGPWNYSVTQIGWNPTIIFPTPFFWDGVSNVIIDLSCSNFPSLTGTNSYTYTDSIFCRYAGITGTGNPTDLELTSLSHKRPNLQLTCQTAPLCTGMPSTPIITGPAAVNPSVFFTLQDSGPEYAGITHRWQMSTDSTTWNETSAGTWGFLHTSQTANTWYRVIDSCVFSGLASQSLPFEVTTTPLPCNVSFTYMQDSLSYAVQFTSFTSAPGAFLWEMGLNDTLYSANPQFDFGSSGSYYVCLTFEDTASGCTDTYCSDVSVQQLPPPSATIGGFVYADANQNGTMDAGEQGIGNQQVALNGMYAYTNPNGYFEIEVPLGTYLLQYDVPSWLTSFWTATGSNTLSLTAGVNGSLYGGNNFGVYIDSAYNDAGIGGWFPNPTPGFYKQVGYQIYNNGAVNQTIQLDVYYDSHLVFDETGNSGWTMLDTINHHVVYQFTVTPVDSFAFSLSYYCPIGTAIGTALFDSAFIAPIGFTDAVAANNNTATQATVVASFDPNEKSVNPAGLGSNHAINPNHVDELTYTVQFQNTGTAPAHFIVVKDTLDNTKVDVPSLRLLHYTHNCHVDITQGHILTAYFDNIMLPDSNTNEPESHGSFTYSIKLLNNLPDFSEVTNKAYIYFDYNPPVITNDAFVTLDEHLNTQEISLTDDYDLYPNPVDRQFALRYSGNGNRGVAYFISDVVGRKLAIGETNPTAATVVNTSGLINGMYCVGIVNDEGLLVTKRFTVLHP